MVDWIGDTISGASLVAVVIIGWRSVLSSERSRKAAEAAIDVAERAARDSLREGRMRRVEGLLDVLIQISELYTEQTELPGRTRDGWQPPYGSPESQARLALCRKLETRLVLFVQLDRDSMTNYLARSEAWRPAIIEEAIIEVKVMLASNAVGMETKINPDDPEEPVLTDGEVRPTASQDVRPA